MAKGVAHDTARGRRLQDSAHSPIDMEHLGRQSLGDPGLQDEVLRIFASMSRVYLDRIEGSSTVAGLIENLHTLKSAAAGIGAHEIGQLVRHLEEELRAGKPVDYEGMEELAAAVEDCIEYIHRLVRSDLH